MAEPEKKKADVEQSSQTPVGQAPEKQQQGGTTNEAPAQQPEQGQQGVVAQGSTTNEGAAQQPAQTSQTEEVPEEVSATADNDYTLPEAPKRWDYAKMQKEFEEKAKAEREADEKKRKRSALFSAIGDGISALSNLYFTTQYAPNAYDGKGTLSEKNKARWDKITKEREERLAAYQKAALDRAGKAYEQSYSEWRDQVKDVYEQAKQRREDAKATRDAAMAQLKYQKLSKEIDEAEYEKQAAKVEADYKEALMQSQINKNNRTGRSRGSGGSKKSGKSKNPQGSTSTQYDGEGNVIRTTVRTPGATPPAGGGNSKGKGKKAFR